MDNGARPLSVRNSIQEASLSNLSSLVFDGFRLFWSSPRNMVHGPRTTSPDSEVSARLACSLPRPPR